MSHTPGSWFVGGVNNTCVVPAEDPHQRICVCWVPRVDDSHAITDEEEQAFLPETQANARLIAAAPELLEACRLSVKWLKKLSADNVDAETDLIDIVEAIAKAEGRDA